MSFYSQVIENISWVQNKYNISKQQTQKSLKETHFLTRSFMCMICAYVYVCMYVCLCLQVYVYECTTPVEVTRSHWSTLCETEPLVHYSIWQANWLTSFSVGLSLPPCFHRSTGITDAAAMYGLPGFWGSKLMSSLT